MESDGNGYTYTNYAGTKEIWEFFRCITCRVEYEFIQYDEQEPKMSYEIFDHLTINGKGFRVIKFHRTPVETRVQVFDEEAQAQNTFPWKDVFSIHHIPDNWTPFNVEEKLTKLLPFI